MEWMRTAMHDIHTKSADPAVLFQPGAHYASPAEVLNDPDLAASEKRVILSSWASDLYAVESCPWLREVPGLTTPLRLSDILAELRTLDDDAPPPKGGAAMRVVHLERLRARAGSQSRMRLPQYLRPGEEVVHSRSRAAA
jgi:hypothetical protein